MTQSMIPPREAFRGILIRLGCEVRLNDLPGFPARFLRILGLSFGFVQFMISIKELIMDLRVAWIWNSVYLFFCTVVDAPLSVGVGGLSAAFC